MRILLVTNLFPPDYDGGYELNAWKVARGLRERGHQVEVATSRFRPAFSGERSDPPWVHRILSTRPDLPSSTWRMPWVRLPMVYRLIHHESIAWVNVPRIRRFLRGHSFDLVYVFGLHDVGLGCAYVPQELGIPVLWHFGDHYLANHRGRYGPSFLYRLVGSTVLRSVAACESKIRIRHAAFVSRFLEGYYADRGISPENSHVIPRGIEFPLSEDLDRSRYDPPVFLLASRLSKDKGIHIALAAASELAQRRPDLSWQVHIAGTGDPEYEQLLRQSASGLSGRLTFLGRLDREEVIKRMANSTAFISASIWGEPFANTIIEALASGTPLIVSDAGSSKEVVEPDVSALVYPRESASALAALMERVLVEPALARSLAGNGLQTIREGYTLDRILDTTEAVMKSCIVAAMATSV